MKILFARISSLALALAACVLILGVPTDSLLYLICLAWLTLFYVLLKPLGQAITLPFNLFLFNLPQLFVDALLVWWAVAWTPGLSLTYLESLVVAVLAALFFSPFDVARIRRLIVRV